LGGWRVAGRVAVARLAEERENPRRGDFDPRQRAFGAKCPELFVEPLLRGRDPGEIEDPDLVVQDGRQERSLAERALEEEPHATRARAVDSRGPGTDRRGARRRR